MIHSESPTNRRMMIAEKISAIRFQRCSSAVSRCRKNLRWTTICIAPSATTNQAVTVRGSLQANTGIALRTAALGHMGIASTAAFIVRDELASGALVQVLPGYTLAPRTLYALYPHSRHLSPKVRALVDFAVAWYRDRDWD